jgi:pimeloyl-ACP methyl ester carboxylesterase
MLTLDKHFSFRGDKVAWGTLGDGPPLVMVHGTPFSSQVWRRIAPWLSTKYTTYFFDLLGYGQSEMRSGQDVSLGIQNEVFTALLKEWRINDPVVVAHDFGGATALRTHYINGIHYKRLILIDPVAMAPWGSPFVQHVRKHEAAFASLPAYAHAALLRAYIAGAAHKPLSADDSGVYEKPWLGDSGQAAFYRQIAQMDQKFTDEIEHRYGPMPFPVEILWGENDNWIPVATGERLAAKLTAGRLTRIASAGHLVQEDAPEAIVAAVLAGH